jgi:hypothetical protein
VGHTIKPKDTQSGLEQGDGDLILEPFPQFASAHDRRYILRSELCNRQGLGRRCNVYRNKELTRDRTTAWKDQVLLRRVTQMGSANENDNSCVCHFHQDVDKSLRTVIERVENVPQIV